MSLRKKRRTTKCFTCLETRARSKGYMAKVFKTWCPKPWLVGSHWPQCSLQGWIRWSLTYYRCLGIKIHSQKSGVRSEELVVERSLKLDALTLIGWESSMDPRYMDNLEKNTFKSCTPTMKKLWTKRCVLSLLEVDQLAKLWKRTRFRGKISSTYYIRKLINNT